MNLKFAKKAIQSQLQFMCVSNFYETDVIYLDHASATAGDEWIVEWILFLSKVPVCGEPRLERQKKLWCCFSPRVVMCP